MKTIKMRAEKSSQWVAILVAGVVAIITSAVVANATQTITTPNAAFIAYNLAAGTSSAPITPATNRSVLVMGCSTNFRGVGHVSLLHINGTISWAGLETPTSNTGGATITSGWGFAAGSHILYIQPDDLVEIATASGDTIQIRNTSVGPLTVTGNVTLIW